MSDFYEKESEKLGNFGKWMILFGFVIILNIVILGFSAMKNDDDTVTNKQECCKCSCQQNVSHQDTIETDTCPY